MLCKMPWPTTGLVKPHSWPLNSTPLCIYFLSRAARATRCKWKKLLSPCHTNTHVRNLTDDEADEKQKREHGEPLQPAHEILFRSHGSARERVRSEVHTNSDAGLKQARACEWVRGGGVINNLFAYWHGIGRRTEQEVEGKKINSSSTLNNFGGRI